MVPALWCTEGVCYAHQDYNLPKHPEIDVPNLHVIKLMQSFKSKELVTELFSWRYYYWCVIYMNDGMRAACCMHLQRLNRLRRRHPDDRTRSHQLLSLLLALIS